MVGSMSRTVLSFQDREAQMSAVSAQRWWLSHLSHSLLLCGAMQCNDVMSGEPLVWLLPGCCTMVRRVMCCCLLPGKVRCWWSPPSGMVSTRETLGSRRFLKYKIPSLPAPNFCSLSQCTGFKFISEDPSEITFLLVENYNYDRSSWS
jgi:hypothetical protein